MTSNARPASRPPTVGNRIAPVRFIVFLVLLPVLYLAYRAAVSAADWKDAAAVAFDGAAVIFLISLVPLVRDCSPDALRAHAANNDANRGFILSLTSILTVVIMAAITGEMKDAQNGETLALVKLIGTLFLIWLFANAIYTMHYAHAYYSRNQDNGGDVGGLDFPGDENPDYSDFAYFAFTLGMTFQTSDVGVTLTTVRRVVLLQSFAAFIFNIGVIAFTINVLGGGS